MPQTIGLVALVVGDYDEAIAWYRDTLGFDLLEDAPRENGKRWVRIGPPGAQTSLLLAEGRSDAQRARIGDQTGGRVGFFLYTDDFHRDHVAMRARGVTFVETPHEEAYGIVAVFEDLYGNRWDLLELRQ